MAAEALAFHVEGMMEDGVAVPDSSPPETIMADPANCDAFHFLVDVPAQSDSGREA